MCKLKNNILANLDYLPTKVDFSNPKTQTVFLYSAYAAPSGEQYRLTVEVIVDMHNSSAGIVIEGFKVLRANFRYDFDPKFKIGIKELTDYIDY